MLDSKAIQDNRDHKIANDNAYLVAHLARKFALTIPEVREIMSRHGTDRKAFEREAHKVAH